MNLEQDTYWNEDTKLFDGTFPSLSSEGSPHIVKVHAKIHTSEETYYEGNREIIPITPRKGKRTNFMIHPYVAVPNITLTIRIPPNGYADTPAIGKVQSAQVEGFRDVKIGHCQAWYYQDAKVLTL